VIAGTGIDLVDIDRVRRLLERYGDRFRERVFTKVEIAFCAARQHAPQHYAVRVAAKEAVMKALGPGWGEGVKWREIETVNEPSGRPVLVLSGRAAEIAAARGVRKSHVSFSHTEEQAIATVILEA